MNKEDLIRYVEPKTKVKLNLKNGRFYNGIILVVGEDSLLFLDKYGSEIMISYDVIGIVEPFIDYEKKEEKKKNGEG